MKSTLKGFIIQLSEGIGRKTSPIVSTYDKRARTGLDTISQDRTIQERCKTSRLTIQPIRSGIKKSSYMTTYNSLMRSS